MMQWNGKRFLGLAAIVCAVGTPALADEAELRARIDDLERRLVAVQSDQEGWLTEQRTEEVRAIVADVLADADTRSSMLQGMTAGYEDGFVLGSADGNFKLKLNGQTQVRFVFNDQDDGAPDDSTRWGFENTRTKLTLTGHVVDPSWIYKIEGGFERDGGSFTLEDAYIGKVFEGGWIFLAGQVKVPLSREYLVDSSKQLAVERSLVDQEFGARRTQGVALAYMGDNLHGTFAVTDGHPGANGSNSLNTPWSMEDTEISLTGRVEYLFAGSWDQFADLTSPQGSETAFMMGAAAHYQKSESGTPSPDLEVLAWTVDASAEFDGANVFASFNGRHFDEALDADQYGVVVQGGYYVTEDWEIYARYEWGDDDSSADDLSILTIGANKYFAGHGLKWTTDVGYAFNAVSPTFGDGLLGNGGDIAGWRTDADDDDGQIVIRSQLQLLF